MINCAGGTEQGAAEGRKPSTGAKAGHVRPEAVGSIFLELIPLVYTNTASTMCLVPGTAGDRIASSIKPEDRNFLCFKEWGADKQNPNPR